MQRTSVLFSQYGFIEYSCKEFLVVMAKCFFIHFGIWTAFILYLNVIILFESSFMPQHQATSNYPFNYVPNTLPFRFKLCQVCKSRPEVHILSWLRDPPPNQERWAYTWCISKKSQGFTSGARPADLLAVAMLRWQFWILTMTSLVCKMFMLT